MQSLTFSELILAGNVLIFRGDRERQMGWGRGSCPQVNTQSSSGELIFWGSRCPFICLEWAVW